MILEVKYIGQRKKKLDLNVGSSNNIDYYSSEIVFAKWYHYIFEEYGPCLYILLELQKFFEESYLELFFKICPFKTKKLEN